MDVKQWDTLTAEAAALVERLQAEKHEASNARVFERVWRLQQIGFRARARWERRCDAWAVAAYGEGVK